MHMSDTREYLIEKAIDVRKDIIRANKRHTGGIEFKNKSEFVLYDTFGDQVGVVPLREANKMFKEAHKAGTFDEAIRRAAVLQGVDKLDSIN